MKKRKLKITTLVLTAATAMSFIPLPAMASDALGDNQFKMEAYIAQPKAGQIFSVKSWDGSVQTYKVLNNRRTVKLTKVTSNRNGEINLFPGTDGCVETPDTGYMLTPVSISKKAIQDKKTVKRLTVYSDSQVKVVKGTFKGCSNLKYLYLDTRLQNCQKGCLSGINKHAVIHVTNWQKKYVNKMLPKSYRKTVRIKTISANNATYS